MLISLQLVRFTRPSLEAEEKRERFFDLGGKKFAGKDIACHFFINFCESGVGMHSCCQRGKFRLAVHNRHPLADEFSGVDIGRDTPKEVLNDLLSRYPTTDEVKG